MKITIDTKEDSQEEIRHAIRLLSHLLEGQGASALIKTAEPVDTANLMNMFSESETRGEAKREIPDTPPDFSSFLNLTKNHPAKERTKIEWY